jgi:tetratricopeptide (TPR) repeat protein
MSKTQEQTFARESGGPSTLVSVNTDELISKGNALKGEGKYNAAIKCFKDLLTNEPRNEKAWYFLADTYTWSRDYGRALSCFEQVVALNPSYPQAKEKVQDMKPVVDSAPHYRSSYMTEKLMLSSISRFNFAPAEIPQTNADTSAYQAEPERGALSAKTSNESPRLGLTERLEENIRNAETLLHTPSAIQFDVKMGLSDIRRNCQEALWALQKGVDVEGTSITPREVGEGLGMLWANFAIGWIDVVGSKMSLAEHTALKSILTNIKQISQDLKRS